MTTVLGFCVVLAYTITALVVYQFWVWCDES